MPKQGMKVPFLGIYLTLPVILLIFVVTLALFTLPLSPTLRASFRITTPNQYTPPTIQIVDATYAKVSLYASSSATKGTIVVSLLGATQGSYSLGIAVTYSETVLSVGNYTSLGDGLYQMYVAYLPRFGEQSSIPYFVTFILYYANGTPASTPLTITLYPT